MRTLFALLVIAVGVAGWWISDGSPTGDRATERIAAQAQAPAGASARRFGRAAPRLEAAAGPKAGRAAVDGVLGDIAPAIQVDERDLSAAYFELLELLRSDSDAVAALEAMLTELDASSSALGISVAALVRLGTPESQEALVRMIDARQGDEEYLRQLVPVIGFSQEPTPELEGRLLALAEDHPEHPTGDMAHLAIGNLASQVHKTDPERSDRIVRSYGDKLAECDEPAQIEGYLAVLGNAAPASLTKSACRVGSSE